MNYQSVVVAKYDYTATIKDELSVRKNERLILLNDASLWWTVKNSEGSKGLVPSNFVKKLKPTLFDSLRSLSRKKDEKQKPGHCLSRSCNSITSEDFAFAIPFQPFSVIVKYSYEAQNADEMSLIAGEEIVVKEKNINGWWKGDSLKQEKSGWFPSNYIISTINSRSDFSLSNSIITENPETGTLPRNVTTIFKYSAERVGELSFLENEALQLLDRRSDSSDGWWKARNSEGVEGFVHQVYFCNVETEDEDSSEVFKTLTSKTLDNFTKSEIETGATFENSSNIENETSNIPSNPISSIGDSKCTSNPKLNNHDDSPNQQTGSFICNQLEVCSDETDEYADRDWYGGSIGRIESENILAMAEECSFLIRKCLSKAGDFTLVMKIRQACKHFRVEKASGTFHIGKQHFPSLDHLVSFYCSHPIYQLEGTKICLGKPCKKQCQI